MKTKKAKHFCFAFFVNKVYFYSTVTDFARFLGWSTLQPRITAI